MNNLKQFLKIENNKFNRKELFIYIFIAYLFTIFIKLFLYYQIYNNSSYFYNNNVIPLWTPDSGLYGFYANQLLSGISYPFISEYMPGYLIYWIVNLTGFSINGVIFFAPIFFSSLVVIPIILIANSYNLAKIGFYSTLFGSIMTSYYYRTHLGYYDTDMLNVVFPLFAIYFLIKLVNSKKIIYGLFATISLLFFHLWYHSSTTIILSIFTTFLLYILIFERKIKYYKYYLFSFILAFFIILSITNTSKYFDRANDYIDKQSIIEIPSKNGTIKLKGDLEIVSEARGIDFSIFAHRVSGGKIFIILAFIGYIALLLIYKSMFLTLPLVVLSLISMSAGLRFTIYGVPIFAFSLLYGVELIFRSIFIKLGKYSKSISNISIKLFLLFIITSAIINVINYNEKLSPFYFSSTEDIEALNKLKDTIKPNDFIIATWDYGWPLWYYSNINTIVDNGKHAEDNFIVSKILLSDNQQFIKNASLFFVNRYKKSSSSKIVLPFLHEYSIDYLKELEKSDYIPPKSNKNIYILLHRGMLSTYEAVEEASNLNLKTGKNFPSNLYNRIFLSKEYNSSQKILKTTTQLSIDIEHGRILSTNPNENANVREITIAKNSKIEFTKSYNSPNNIFIVIDKKKVFITNKKLYNSFLIQALVFNKYDHKLFTEFTKTKNFIILKVKNN